MTIDQKVLARLEALDENGQPVSLSSLWQEKQAAMVFVRHFG